MKALGRTGKLDPLPSALLEALDHVCKELGPLAFLVMLALIPLTVTWLILPVVICLSQRLSHARVSKSLAKVKPRMAH